MRGMFTGDVGGYGVILDNDLTTLTTVTLFHNDINKSTRLLTTR